MTVNVKKRIARTTIVIVALVAALGLAAAPADASTRDSRTPGVVSVLVLPANDLTTSPPPSAEYQCVGNHCTCEDDADCLALVDSGKCDGAIVKGVCKQTDD